MVFENEINIFNPDAIANEFHTQSTQISAVQGKIGAMISDSQIQELQSGGTNLYSRLVSAEMDINGISTQVSSLQQVDGQLESQISTVRQTASSISAEVSSVKNNYAKKSQIILAINNTTQESETIISAEHISLAGKRINLTSENVEISSNNFSVDRYGNMVARSGTFSGTIRGANITLGGASNANGWVEILNASGQRVGRWDNGGQYIGNIVSSLSNPNTRIGSDGAIVTKSLTANDYVYVNGNTDSYIKIPSRGSNYSEFGRLGFHTYTAGNGSDTVGSEQAGVTVSNSEYTGATNRVEIYDDSISIRSSDTYRAYISEYADFMGNVYVDGSLVVSGSKPRLVQTKDYGKRYLYCYETPSPLFGDVGEGVISEDGKCYVKIDSIFAETVTLSQYQVFLQKYGNGDCWVFEKTSAYFVVEGTPYMKFGWELKAKQSDFDQYRLEQDAWDTKFEPKTTDYGQKLNNHIEAIRSEREVEA